MNRRSSEEAVRRTVTVRVLPDRAFAVFTDELATWWPREYTWARDVLDTIGIEPTEGGRCFERGPYGFWCNWGRVLVWDPPSRLVFSWQISPRREPDPAKASEVEVRFVAEGLQATRVELAHRSFERHGEGSDGYRAALDSEQGWSLILDRYAAAAIRA